jgi:putative isomerase
VNKGKLNFDLRQVPFSYYGSYMVFSILAKKPKRKPGLYMRSIHPNMFNSAPNGEIFKIELTKNRRSVPYRITVDPAMLKLEAEQGEVKICFAGPDEVRITGRGVGLRLVMPKYIFKCVFPRKNRSWQVNDFGGGKNYILVPVKGKLNVDAPWTGVDCTHAIMDFVSTNGSFDAAIKYSEAVPEKISVRGTFNDCLGDSRKSFKWWLRNTLKVPEKFEQARQLAAYIQWSSMVESGGQITRPGMLMSKNWMTQIWSWDNCFNAMAVNYRNPGLAWDQLMVIADKQDATGVFPDSVNARNMCWNFCKPPVHGWAIKKMMKNRKCLTKARMDEIYPRLVKWTEWWFKYRDDDNDGVPQYNHGNDSGWDNSTVFIGGVPLETPDLSAFLVIQMETLSLIAGKLGRKEESKEWKRRSKKLLVDMLDHFWYQIGRASCRERV